MSLGYKKPLAVAALALSSAFLPGCSTVSKVTDATLNSAERISSSDNKGDAFKKEATGFASNIFNGFKKKFEQGKRIFNNFTNKDGTTKDSKKEEIKAIQRELNRGGFLGANGKSLSVDGDLGPKPETSNTMYSFYKLQEALGEEIDFSPKAVKGGVDKILKSSLAPKALTSDKASLESFKQAPIAKGVKVAFNM